MHSKFVEWVTCVDPHCPNARWPGEGHQHLVPGPPTLADLELDGRGSE